MNEKFYLSLHTQEPTRGESGFVTKDQYSKIEWAGSDKTYTFKGWWTESEGGALIGFSALVPVPSWRHPIKMLRAIKWNRNHGEFRPLNTEGDTQ